MTATDPDLEVRTRLIEAAARMLAEQGPESVSSRAVALAADTSIMGVYSQFGSLEKMVEAVVEEGFRRLAVRFAEVRPSDDPVGDLAALSRAYAEHAHENPNVHRVMFGDATLGQYRRSTPYELRTGRDETLDIGIATCERAISAGRFHAAKPVRVAVQWWSGIHGYTLLELAGYIAHDGGNEKILVPLLTGLMTGFGDDPVRAEQSVRAAFSG